MHEHRFVSLDDGTGRVRVDVSHPINETGDAVFEGARAWQDGAEVLGQYVMLLVHADGEKIVAAKFADLSEDRNVEALWMLEVRVGLFLIS